MADSRWDFLRSVVASIKETEKYRLLTDRRADRTRHFNEWLVHRLRRAELAPEAVALADAICAGDLAVEEKARRALLNAYGIWREVTDGRYPDRNTYSDGLTEGRLTGFPD